MSLDHKLGPPLRLARLSSGHPAPRNHSRETILFARSLQAETTVAGMLSAIAHAAVERLPGADFAGISQVSHKGAVLTMTMTDPVVAQIDHLQLMAGQGPGVTAVREQCTVRVDDVRRDARWPKFTGLAASVGVESMVILQLFVQDEILGTLNVYARRANAFDDDAEDVGIMLAAHGALAMFSSRQSANLLVGLASRDVIGQAKGILMERHRIDPDAAFQLLVAASQRNNRKLTTIAEMVATTGQELTDENIRGRGGRGQLAPNAGVT